MYLTVAFYLFFTEFPCFTYFCICFIYHCIYNLKLSQQLPSLQPIVNSESSIQSTQSYDKIGQENLQYVEGMLLRHLNRLENSIASMKQSHTNQRSFTNQHCVKSIQIRSFFSSVFSCIRTENGDLLLVEFLF